MSMVRRNSPKLDVEVEVELELEVEVGEIDTSSPFSSVKDAVSLFGEIAFSGDKTPVNKARSQSAEMAFVKVTQLHLAEKQVNKLKKQLNKSETGKAEAVVELDKAKRRVEDLTLRLKAASQSKEWAVEATEAANTRLKQHPINGAMEAARERCAVAITELNDAKLRVTKGRQEFDAALEAKVAALRHAEEAYSKQLLEVEKSRELSKEISAIRVSIETMKEASLQAQQGQARLFAEKDVQKQSYKATLEAYAQKLLDLKSESDSQVNLHLQAQLAETEGEIDSLRKQMEDVKARDLDSLKAMESQLDGAKESLQRVAQEESSLRSLADARREELANAKKERSESLKKESETEFIAGGLNTKLQRSRCELEACAQEEAKARGASDDLRQMSLEAENARREAEEMLSRAREMRNEAQGTRGILGELQKKLIVALGEAREAKAAEAKAVEEIKGLTETTSAARASTSESITISREEYESLSRKVEESVMVAEMKVSAAMAQVEAVKASEKESANKVEVSEEEMEQVRAATESALRKADMAEMAKMAVEGELGRWRRERERKRAAEAAIPKQQAPPRKLDKAKTSVPKKSVMRNLSGIFRKKKNHSLSVGGSPSYLPDNPAL